MKRRDPAQLSKREITALLKCISMYDAGDPWAPFTKRDVLVRRLQRRGLVWRVWRVPVERLDGSIDDSENHLRWIWAPTDEGRRVCLEVTCPP